MAAKWLFKDGKLQFANSKIQFVPNGDSASDCSCCESCSSSSTSCSSCDDITPSQYEVLFSGVSLCLCQPTDLGDWWSITSTIDINDTHILTQNVGSPCSWQVIYSNAVTLTTYADSGCTTVNNSDTGDMTINLTRSATTWSLSATTIVQPSFPLINGILFIHNNVTAQTNDVGQICSTVPSFINSNNSCFPSPLASTPVATGGSATVVCL